MIPLALGLAAAATLLWAANAFAKSPVRNIKSLLAWITALAGISLVAMLLLTGRGPAALSGLILLAPLAWSFWAESRRAPGSPPNAPRMSRHEALSVLGLPENASESDIRTAWVRLMRAVHPDSGGTDWLAARVNQARDILLRR